MSTYKYIIMMSNVWTSPLNGSAGSKESIKLIEELIEWSIMGRVQWQSKGLMVH